MCGRFWGQCYAVMFPSTDNHETGSADLECPKCQKQIPTVYFQTLHLDCFKSLSFLGSICYRRIQMPLHLAKLIGLECCWLLNWDTDKKHNSLSCIRGFITKDTHKTAPNDVKSNQRWANKDEGGLCLSSKLKVDSKYFLMPPKCVYVCFIFQVHSVEMCNFSIPLTWSLVTLNAFFSFLYIAH